MPITIDSYQPPRSIMPLFHWSFVLIYVLLLMRLIVTIYEGPQAPFVFHPTSLAVSLLKRASGILIEPVWMVLPRQNFNLSFNLYLALVFSICTYALVHYGMTINVSREGKSSMADKILKLCKGVFFFVATLMLLLIVARMGVMLYGDVTVGRTVIAVPANR